MIGSFVIAYRFTVCSDQCSYYNDVIASVDVFFLSSLCIQLWQTDFFTLHCSFGVVTICVDCA